MSNLYKRVVTSVAVFMSLVFAGNTFAVVINFDDLIPSHDPDYPCFCDYELTNEYADKGLTFHDGYLDGESLDGGLTYQNYLVTGPYGQIIFVGKFPTFVSMLVTSIHNDAIYLSAWGPDGFLETKKTPGFGGPFDNTPPEANFYISFTAEKGIRFIDVSAFYFRRSGAIIDNITYTYTSASEPAPFLLMMLGLTVLMGKKIFPRMLQGRSNIS